MEQKIQDAIAQIRPFLQRDGGDIEFVELTEDNIVKVRLQGHCAGCPGATMTIKGVVERLIKETYPEIQGVEAVSNRYENTERVNCRKSRHSFLLSARKYPAGNAEKEEKRKSEWKRDIRKNMRNALNRTGRRCSMLWRRCCASKATRQNR